MLRKHLRQPRSVLYTCSICGGFYESITTSNPLWDIQSSQCKICASFQIPRLDIEHPLNSMQHDSFYKNIFEKNSEGTDNLSEMKSEDEETDVIIDKDERLLQTRSINIHESILTQTEEQEDEDDNIDDDGLTEVTQADISEMEEKNNYQFRFEKYFSQSDAVNLVILMTHARLCTGVHISPEHTELCKSVKFLMLHLRDCTQPQCPLRWCCGGKLVVHHLSHCFCPSLCVLCSPSPDMPLIFQQIHNQNNQNILSSSTNKP